VKLKLKNDGIFLNIDESYNSGFPVIFQHGLTGDSKQSAEIFPLNQNFYRITLECRGHGISDIGNSKFFSIKYFADDIIKLIKKRKLKKIIIGGLSMGAAIALRIAILEPKLIKGLILARPAWITKSNPKNLKPFIYIAELIQNFSQEKGVSIFLNSKISKEIMRKSPDNFNSLVSLFDKIQNNNIAEMVKCIAIDGPNVSENQICNIQIPTLIIGNKNDFIHPLSYAKKLSNMIKNSKLEIITSKSESYENYFFEFRDKLNLFLQDLLI